MEGFDNWNSTVQLKRLSKPYIKKTVRSKENHWNTALSKEDLHGPPAPCQLLGAGSVGLEAAG